MQTAGLSDRELAPPGADVVRGLVPTVVSSSPLSHDSISGPRTSDH
jgi:hypothetical protein